MLYTTILALCLFAMRWLAPTQAEGERLRVAEAMATVVSEEEPIVRDDASRVRTAALVLAVSYREGSFGAKVEGDCTESKPGAPCKGRPRSFCTMQIHESNGGGARLNESPEACIRKGVEMLRRSARTCPEAPVAWYAAGGVEACSNERAKRISRDRMGLAKRIYQRASEREGI